MFALSMILGLIGLFLLMIPITPNTTAIGVIFLSLGAIAYYKHQRDTREREAEESRRASYLYQQSVASLMRKAGADATPRHGVPTMPQAPQTIHVHHYHSPPPTPTKNQQQNMTGIGCAMILLFAIGATLISTGQPSTSRRTTATPTQRATSSVSAHPAYDRVANNTERQIINAWGRIARIRRIDLVFFQTGFVAGEVCVTSGNVSTETADMLYRAALAVTVDASIQFSVIIADTSDAADFIFDTRSDSWSRTDLPVNACR